MDTLDYYQDKKYCPCCQGYVNYLMSIEHSFCVDCGGEVRLFSKEDWESFHEGLKTRKPKGGRPRKKTADQNDQQRDRESA
ncbi:MAG: hypothetical protein O2816_05420 [Planctomycetota bacterium]|nr:hypothetical protein [Planctomycetota bacterium]